MLGFLKSWMVGTLYRVLFLTWRIEHCNEPKVLKEMPLVLGHWHGDELVLIGPFSFRGYAVLVSHSRDGGMLTQILKRFGFWVVRGSSSRGAVGGLKGLADAGVKEKRTVCVAVDGPRGPAFKVKPGIVRLAELTQAPVVLGAAASRNAIHFPKAWNKTFLPLPFSKSFILYSDPFLIPANLNNDELEEWKLKIEQTLLKLKREVEMHAKSR